MNKAVDCFFIGHNETDFPGYEKQVHSMGIHSGAYRDLNLNFITYNNRPYTAKDMFNLIYCNDPCTKVGVEPFTTGETFSAAAAYLGTYLHRRGFTFDYVNSFREEKDTLAEKLEQGQILTIAIITTLYVSAFPIFEIMAFIKKYNQGAKIIVGGPFVSTQARIQEPGALKTLFQSIGADVYVNSSQGETTLVKLLSAFKNNLSLENINNIYYKSGDGKRHQYNATPILKENNRLSENYVNWNLFSDRMGQYVNIRTAISCPFSCAFCGFPQHAGKYQWAETEIVEKELNQLSQIEPVKVLTFIDDTFNVPAKRCKEILKMMIRNKYSFKWNSHFRCQFADREIVELMKESGCQGVFLGIESGSEPILKNMNKAAKVEDYLRGITLLKEYGIMTYGSFIVGFPGETDETITSTKEFIKKSGLDFYRAQPWYCEPITPIWNERKTYHLHGESFEWSHATMNSKRASDLVEEIFLSINQPTWVPQYYFECDGLFHLLNRGLTFDRIRQFLNDFNRGVKEKLLNPRQKQVSFEVIKEMKESFQKSNCFDESCGREKQEVKMLEADFDF